MKLTRKPLAKVEGRRRMRRSGLTITWRGTPELDDWVAYIDRAEINKLILADRVSERTVKVLLAQLQGMTRREIKKLAKG